MRRGPRPARPPTLIAGSRGGGARSGRPRPTAGVRQERRAPRAGRGCDDDPRARAGGRRDQAQPALGRTRAPVRCAGLLRGLDVGSGRRDRRRRRGHHRRCRRRRRDGRRGGRRPCRRSATAGAKGQDRDERRAPVDVHLPSVRRAGPGASDVRGRAPVVSGGEGEPSGDRTLARLRRAARVPDPSTPTQAHQREGPEGAGIASLRAAPRPARLAAPLSRRPGSGRARGAGGGGTRRGAPAWGSGRCPP